MDLGDKASQTLGASLVFNTLRLQDPDGINQLVRNATVAYEDMNGHCRRFAAAYDHVDRYARQILDQVTAHDPELVRSWLAAKSIELGSPVNSLVDAANQNILGEAGVVTELARFFSPLGLKNDQFVTWLPQSNVDQALEILTLASKRYLDSGTYWVGDQHLGHYAENGFFLKPELRLLSHGGEVLINRDWLVDARSLLRKLAERSKSDPLFEDLVQDLKHAYIITEPPVPATAESFLELLKDERISEHPVGGGIMLRFYNIFKLGDLIVIDLNVDSSFLNRPVNDQADAKLEDTVRASLSPILRMPPAEMFITRPLNKSQLESIQHLLADRGVDGDKTPEAIKALYSAWSQTEGALPKDGTFVNRAIGARILTEDF